MSTNTFLRAQGIIIGVVKSLLLLVYWPYIYINSEREWPQRLFLPLFVFGLSSFLYITTQERDTSKNIFCFQWLLYHIFMIFYNFNSPTRFPFPRTIALTTNIIFALFFVYHFYKIKSAIIWNRCKDPVLSTNLIFLVNGIIETITPILLYFSPHHILQNPDYDGTSRLAVPIFAAGLGSLLCYFFDHSQGKKMCAWSWVAYHGLTVFQLAPTGLFHSDNLAVGLKGISGHAVLCYFFMLYLKNHS
jgi:hypothetical protein